MSNIPVIAEINNLLDANDVTIAKAALSVLGAATTGNASIVAGDIATGAVTEGKILDGAVTVGKIGALAVTDAKLAANAVTTAKILDANVTSGKLAVGAAEANITLLPVAKGGTGTASPAIVAGTNVTVSGTWPNQTITAASGGTPADGSITTAKIADANVTTAKLADGAVTVAKTTGLQSNLFVGTNNNFVFEGDSITSGSNLAAGNDWPTFVMATNTFSGKGTKYNYAVASSYISTMDGRYTASVYPRRPAANGGAPAYLFVFCGTNNINTYSSASIISELEAYWLKAKNDGFIVIAFTITPQNFSLDNELKRQAINSAIRLSQTWDYLVDTASLLPNKSDTLFYLADGVHPAINGNRIISRLVESVILSKNKAPVPDLTSARSIAGSLVLGSTNNPTTSQTLMVYNEASTGGESSIGNTISSIVTPTASSGQNHIACSVSCTQIGTYGLQYLTGIDSKIRIKSANNISYGYAFSGQCVTDSAGGAINNAVSFLSNSPYAGSGVIVSSIGFLAQTQKATNVTTGYGFCSNGSEDLNYFAGKFRVGSTTNPVYTLDITGDTAVSGNVILSPIAQTATTAAVSITTATTALTTTAPAQSITLANGVAGQIKTITHVATSGSGSAVLTPATKTGYTTITFTNVGDTVKLQYYATIGWVIVSIRGAVAA